MSVISWTLFLGKYLITRIKIQQLHAAQKRILTCVTTQDFAHIVVQTENTLAGYIIEKQRMQLDAMAVTGTIDWQLHVANSQQLIDTLIAHEEQFIPFLSTTAAVAPLLGLFGTVWGLVQAFVGISERQTADIVAVAPGIAQALVTTLAGLVVAIPAFVFYNYLQVRAQSFESELINFMNALNMCMQRISHKDA
jgi:biopolymer transport protein ExbB/TolQ